MRNVFKYFFILCLSFISLSVLANDKENADVQNNKVNQETFIVNCKKNKNSQDCTSIKVNSEKIINQNDILFIGQRLYMDNYSPLFFNQLPGFIDNSFYGK